MRDSFIDTAGEETIKKEHYEPLGQEPPPKNNGDTTVKKGVEDTPPPLPPVDYDGGNGDTTVKKGVEDTPPPLPPVDYNGGNGDTTVKKGVEDTPPPLPPVDYNGGNGDTTVKKGVEDTPPPLPPVDYDGGNGDTTVKKGVEDTPPPLPPVDYNGGNGDVGNSNGGDSSKKKVSFDDELVKGVTEVPGKGEDSTRTPDDNNYGVEDLSKALENLSKEQADLAGKLDKNEELTKEERDRLAQIEKDIKDVGDALNDAIGRENADRPDNERLVDELNELLKEQAALTTKQKLSDKDKERLSEIENDLRTIINTIQNREETSKIGEYVNKLLDEKYELEDKIDNGIGLTQQEKDKLKKIEEELKELPSVGGDVTLKTKK